MMAMPICAIMLMAMLLSNTSGANSSTKAKSDQMNQRPTLMGRN